MGPRRLSPIAVGLATAAQVAALWLAWRMGDWLFVAGALLLPAVTAAVFGAALQSAWEKSLRAVLGRPLKEKVPPLEVNWLGAWLRGHGLGLIALGVFFALDAFAKDESVPMMLATGVATAGLIAGVMGQRDLNRRLFAAARPWRALQEMHRHETLSGVRPLAEIFDSLRTMPGTSGQVISHAREWLRSVRDRSVEQLVEMAREGRGRDAIEEMERWPSVREDIAALMEFLALGAPAREKLRAEVLRVHHSFWNRAIDRAEEHLSEAKALMEKAEAHAALERAEAALALLPDIPGSPAEDLRERAAALERLINQRLIETHRDAQAAREAVATPVEHPYTDTPQPHLAPQIRATHRPDHEAKAREAMGHAKQFLERNDHPSAHGWLLHAEHHADQVGGAEGVALREQVRNVRALCSVKTEPRPSPDDQPEKAPPVTEAPAQGEVDAERVFAEYVATHEKGEAKPEGAERGWQDGLAFFGAVLFLLGFALPWQRGLIGSPSPHSLSSGGAVFDLPGRVAADMGAGQVSLGLLAYLELIGLGLLAFGVIYAGLIGLLRLAAGRLPRTLGWSAAVGMVIAILAACGLWVMVLVNRSTLAWNIIRDLPDLRGLATTSPLTGEPSALPPPGQSLAMISNLMAIIGPGPMLMIIGLALVAVGTLWKRR